MKRMLIVVALVLSMLAPAWPQTKPQASKTRDVLGLYEKFLAVEEKLDRLDKRFQQLEKDLKPFVESDSALNQLAGAAMMVGALKLWILEARELATEEDSLIARLVTASSSLMGDSGRHADEGVRLLREQHVYLKQGIERAERLIAQMTDLFRSIREDRLADLPELLDEREFAAQIKAIDELEQRRELVLARGKDAFLRFKATSK